MLYDPKRWKPKTVVPEVVSVEGLAAWLRKQDPNKRYTLDPVECLFAQYLRASGFWFVWCSTGTFKSGLFFTTKIPREINHVVWGERTFGAALKRAEKILGVKNEKEV